MDRRIILVVLAVGLLALFPIAASAVTVTLTPDSIVPGEQVKIDMTGLPDGARVSIGISGVFAVVPGDSFSFGISDLNFPFGLGNGTISAEQQGTQTNAIEVRRGDTIVLQTGNSVNGRFSKSFSFTIPPGTIDYVRLSGTAAAGTIAPDLSFSGIKTGPDDGEITFDAGGMENGDMTVRITVNDTVVLARTIPVESGDTPVPTPVRTGTVGGSDNEGMPSSSTTGVTTGVTAAPVTTSVVVFTTETPTAAETPSPTPFVTPDRTTALPTTTRAGFGMLGLTTAAGLAVALFLARRH